MPNYPTIGLALSGSGSGTAFYIGFLEVLQENNIQIDYLTACSGATIVAAAYACGTLTQLKETSFHFNKESLYKLLRRKNTIGGIYSLDLAEDEFRTYTKNMNFEDVKPHMGFVAVDIENGEQVVLSIGDIARAARISCTLPGIFEPVKWGGKTLIDGGLLSIVPVDLLKQAGMDVTIGVNMRGSRHIFSESMMTFKKMLDGFKKILLLDQIGKLIEHLVGEEELEYEVSNKQGIFTILGKSLDIANEANKKDYTEVLSCDLMIYPKIPKMSVSKLNESPKIYEMGRMAALENLPKIQTLIEEKKKAL